MLVVLYIISAISSIFSGIFIEKEKLKHWFVATLFAILTGLAFCLAMIDKMANNLIEINFWSIFAILSLIAWHGALLFNNWEYLFDYEFSFALLACVICLLYPIAFPTFRWGICREAHCTTEIVYLLTTIDSPSTGECVYGDGYVVKLVKIYASNLGNSGYYYFYHLEDNIPIEEKIPVHKTCIQYISDDQSPYLEINTIRDCAGYNSETGKHSLGFAEKTYTLYIPENSIQNALKTNNK